jgi:hypothetical protein
MSVTGLKCLAPRPRTRAGRAPYRLRLARLVAGGSGRSWPAGRPEAAGLRGRYQEPDARPTVIVSSGEWASVW